MKNEVFGQIGEIIIFIALLGFFKTIDGKFHLGMPMGVRIVLSALGVALYTIGKYKWKKSKRIKEERIKKKILEDEEVRLKAIKKEEEEY